MNFSHSKYLCALAAVCLTIEAQAAEPAPIHLSLDPRKPGAAVPADFAGLSFETSHILAESNGWHFFRPDNQKLANLMHSLGISSFRIGGDTADKAAVPVPSTADIDSLFGFAKAAGVKVIYTVRLKDGDMQSDVEIARYIRAHYSANLRCLAIGNEPNFYFKQYSEYAACWRKYRDGIAASVPDLPICGPGVSHLAADWGASFADDFGAEGHLSFLAMHAYLCGNRKKVVDAAKGRELMLSAEMLERYESFYRQFAPQARRVGLPYRLEESNNYASGGAPDVSDSYAAALWGLDYLHWWAAHNALGIEFHNGVTTSYSAFWPAPDGFQVLALGYGLKAFSLGGQGRCVPVTMANAQGVNLTAYGMLASNGTLYATLINKEHGEAARTVKLTLEPGAEYGAGQAMSLVCPQGDIALKTGIVLGNSSINGDGSWSGVWQRLAAPDQGKFQVEVSPASAVVVKLTASR